MLPENLKTAIQNYLSGTATNHEKELVNEWYYSFNDESVEIPTDQKDIREQVKERIKARLSETLQIPIGTKVVPMYQKALRIASVAAILVLIAGGFYWFTKNNENPTNTTAQTNLKNDVLPAIKRSHLTLDDGKEIVLDASNKGLLANQGGMGVTNTAEGLVYKGTDDGKVHYNTITILKGEQSQNVVLSDGTKILVDANSTVKFPVAFTGDKREITYNGRIFLDVAKNPNMPFWAIKGDKKVRVYGTHFCISAYDNEPDMKVTLVEGSVEVTNGTKTGMLKPGQQAILSKENENIELIKDADVEQATAWTRDLTVFHSADVQTIMREVERLYNVEVEIKGNIPKRSFLVDGVPRSAKLSELLKIFEVNNIHYTIDGENKKLTIVP